MPHPADDVVARIWKGAVAGRDGDAYSEYMEQTGVPGYVNASGNIAALMLRRDGDELTEFVMFTLCESMDAVKRFAGEEPEKAVFYPEDDRFLVEREMTVTHYHVTAALDLAALQRLAGGS